jgi:hypothetical protein
MGEHGRLRVEREFDLSQMRLAYDALYDELIDHRVEGLNGQAQF